MGESSDHETYSSEILAWKMDHYWMIHLYLIIINYL